MLRRVLAFLPFVAPFVIYGIYFLMMRRRALAGGGTAPSLSEAPWMWLVIVGFVLLAVSLVVFAIYDGSDVGGSYIPSRFEDGRIVPGEIK
ncbi:MAG: hypothetical protein IH905_15855 [Proteobacteria bacterium]|nr:hypothetical protein [Pseudomonadota bacterium]